MSAVVYNVNLMGSHFAKIVKLPVPRHPKACGLFQEPLFGHNPPSATRDPPPRQPNAPRGSLPKKPTDRTVVGVLAITGGAGQDPVVANLAFDA